MTDNISGRDYLNAIIWLATKEIAPTIHAGKMLLIDPTTPANIQAVSAAGAAKVDGSSVTQPISATALPLPAGASTEASLAALGAKTPALGLALPAASSPVVLPNIFTVTGPAALSAINLNLIDGAAGWTDVSGYKSISMQILAGVGITAGAITAEQSNDGLNVAVNPVYDVAGIAAISSGTVSPAASTSRIYTVAVQARFVRFRISTPFAGGTVQGVFGFSQLPWMNWVINVPQPGSALIGDIGMQYRASATGGAIGAKVLSTASTNATLVKALAGRVVGYHLTNTSAAVKYFRLYNLAVVPTVGTSSPLMVLPISANSTVTSNLPGGIACTAGISYAITGAAADLDTTATAANDVVGSVFYA